MDAAILKTTYQPDQALLTTTGSDLRKNSEWSNAKLMQSRTTQ